MVRVDGRAPDELRPVRIVRGVQAFAEGSAMITQGRTRVLCTVSVEERVPSFLRGQNRGWVTAEYGMLPRATPVRTPRDSSKGRPSGRSLEIQRLIGRSLRSIMDMDALGERTLTVDCDVLQGDGGTRTAAITGAYVALWEAMHTLGLGREAPPLSAAVAGLSAGIVDGALLLDLCYAEDSKAEVDFNLVMTDKGELIEVQGTAEGRPFSMDTMNSILEVTKAGMNQLFDAQRKALEELEAVKQPGRSRA
ncbi:MAG: ribonuclease PH [Dehalococcoidia bacterium]